jgi:hypothetical protein
VWPLYTLKLSTCFFSPAHLSVSLPIHVLPLSALIIKIRCINFFMICNEKRHHIRVICYFRFRTIYIHKHTSGHVHITLKKRKFVATHTIRRTVPALLDSLVTNIQTYPMSKFTTKNFLSIKTFPSPVK